MSTFKRLTAEEAEPLFQAGVVMRFDANGIDDPKSPGVMRDYNRALYGRAVTASPLTIMGTGVVDCYRWWVEVE